MKIHILGASGSGVTTLGLYLSERCGIPYFDNDGFFWEKSDPPFTVRRDPDQRNALLLRAIEGQDSWIIGGSMINWAVELEYDLVVFLLIPNEIRIERLKKRELERYGDIIYKDEERNSLFKEFISWASGYDDNSARGRTFLAHQEWIETLHCPVLELADDLSVEERTNLILLKLDQNI